MVLTRSVLQRSRYALLALGVSIGCRRGESEVRDVQPEAWRRGDRVVVESRAGEFYEAQVVGVDGDVLYLQGLKDRASAVASASEVYRLPPPASSIGRDQLVVCAPEGRWLPCRSAGLVAASASAPLHQDVAVVDIEGRERRIPRHRVIVPSELTMLNLERRFAAIRQREEFNTDAARAGGPLIARKWNPAPRERVIARRPEGWFTASIRELEKERVHVQWEADGRITEISHAEIAPVGPYPEDP